MAQIARPIADIAIGAWTKQDLGGSNLFAAIDDPIKDSADYIRVANPDATVYEAQWGPLVDPASAAGHVYRYELGKQGTGRINFLVELRQGSTVIAAWSHEDVGALTEYAQTLTSGEANAITDYTTPLRLWVMADQSIFRDLFDTAVSPIVTPRTAEPGPGTWTVAGSEWSIVAGALRGGGDATSPAWGGSRLKHTSGLARQNGRAFRAYVIPEDGAADLAIGWATGTVADPRTDGHSWLLETGALEVAQPGVKVVIDAGARNLRPIEYLVIVALRATGAFYLISTLVADDYPNGAMTDRIGIPAYPAARVLHVEDAATTATMYPVISALGTLGYPNGHFVEDARVLDVTAWQSDQAFAVFLDRCTRADSAVSAGTATSGQAWTALAGTWGIASNKIYRVSASGMLSASSGLSSGDGIWRARITADTVTPANPMGLHIRTTDVNNYIRVWNNATNNQIVVQSWVGGGFGDGFGSAGFTWTAGQTYDWEIHTKGNAYKVLIDGVDPFGQWVVDANSRFLTATQWGPYSYGNTTDAKWDDLMVLPSTITLPAELQVGNVPTAWTIGSTQVTDTFTGTNGTRLNAHTTDTGSKTYTEHNGTWTIQTNKASVTGSGLAFATFTEVTDDYEASVDVTLPGTLPTGNVRAGLTFKYQDANNFLATYVYKDSGTSEIELRHHSGGTGLGGAGVVHKVDLSSTGFVAGGTYTIAVQTIDTAYGEMVRVFLDGKLRISYVLSTPSVGTRVGLYRDLAADDGSVLDNLTIKAVS